MFMRFEKGSENTRSEDLALFKTFFDPKDYQEWMINDFDPATAPSFYYRDSCDELDRYVWNPINILEPLGPLDREVQEAHRDHDNDRYSVYITMVNRIDALYRLLREIKNKGPIIATKISKILMKWIDSHIPLCIFMELTGKYKDDEILNDNIYKLIKPNDSLAFDINSLPNCAVHCLYSKIWGDSNRDDSPFDSVIDSSIIDILSKSISTACKIRGVSQKVFTKIESDPVVNKSNDLINDFFTISTSQVLLDVIVRIITASMLGMCISYTLVHLNRQKIIVE